MRNITSLRWVIGVVALLVFASLQAATDDNALWRDTLQQQYFPDKSIIESDDVIELEAPGRAENAAIVPLKIKAKFPQTDERYIKTITLLIDKNPVPLAARFQFTPRSGSADLAMRVRVNAYTPIRAIAETSDGKLYMTQRFVKASGGCSAPVGSDLEAAMKRLGKMKFRVKGEDVLMGEPLQTQLAVSHPNITGMQMDQVTHLYVPAQFLQSVHVTFEGETVFSAETDISISENPNFRFYFVPSQPGQLQADVVDSNGLKFSHSYDIGEASAVVSN